MTWTVSEDENKTIHVRATLDPDQQQELRDLIYALDRRLIIPEQKSPFPTTENTDGTT